MTITFKPLTREESMRIKSKSAKQAGQEINYSEMISDTLKASITQVEFHEEVKYPDGEVVQIEASSGRLTDQGVETLSLCLASSNLDLISAHLIKQDYYSLAQMTEVTDSKKS